MVLSFDEKGKTPIKKFLGRKWTNDKHFRIPYAQKVKGLVDIFAAWDPHNERIYYRTFKEGIKTNNYRHIYPET